MQHNQLNEQNITNDLVQALIKERRSERRWKNIRFFIGLFIIVVIGCLVFKQKAPAALDGKDEKGYVALIHLDGMIAPGENFSAEDVLPLLRDAFRDTEAKGIILDINSGGGTPVQASIIHDGILEMKKKYHKKVIVVGEDLMASGAYFIAVAADKIYVNPNTITGSIGVIMKGFGFPELIKKYGIERRVYTAGVNKDRLDPFLPQNKEDIAKVQSVIKEVHENFIQTVMEGRKGKLHGDTKELFSGDFWSGQTAVKLGLVDALGNLSDVMQSEFHVSHYKDYSQSGSLLRSLASQFGTSLGTSLSNDQVKVLEKI
jgi:protease IV